jgi:hypothetical protein
VSDQINKNGEKLNIYFTKEYIQLTKKSMKRSGKKTNKNHDDLGSFVSKGAI